MRVTVKHDIDSLQRDCIQVPRNLYREGSRIVRENVAEGGRTARRIARWKSGPHGSSYYKRITWDRSASNFVGFGGGAMQGEYGPHDGGTPVGGGWRHGVGNTELDESLDIVAPKFRRDVDRMIDGLFWPGGAQ